MIIKNNKITGNLNVDGDLKADSFETNDNKQFLPLTGGALSGDVTTTLSNNQFTLTSLVNKSYVDTAISQISSGIPDAGNSVNTNFTLTRQKTFEFITGTSTNYADVIIGHNNFNFGYISGSFNKTENGKKRYLYTPYIAKSSEFNMFNNENLPNYSNITIYLTSNFSGYMTPSFDYSILHFIGNNSYTIGNTNQAGFVGRQYGSSSYSMNTVFIFENVVFSPSPRMFDSGTNPSNCVNVIIKNCTFNNAFEIPCVPNGSVTVENSYFADDATLVASGSGNFTIKDCIFNGTTGLTVTNSESNPYTGRGIITNNHFIQTGANVTVDSALTTVYDFSNTNGNNT